MSLADHHLIEAMKKRDSLTVSALLALRPSASGYLVALACLDYLFEEMTTSGPASPSAPAAAP